MLKIIFGDYEDVIYNTSAFFKYNYKPAWLDDPRVKQMIYDVDSSTVLGTGAIESPALGVIAPPTLSGGVKALILIDKVPEKVFNASNCGNNCATWLLRNGTDKDVTVNLRHLMDFGDGPFEVEIANGRERAHSMRELLALADRYL